MTVLVTGGAGYIGSHTIIDLLENNYQVVAIDNLSNSSFESIKRIKEVTNRHFDFYKVDLRNKKELDDIFLKHDISCVLHFAGLKSVSDSIKNPLNYYDNNVFGTLNLLSLMIEHCVYRLIFSSSATVYGVPEKIPVTENCQTGGTTNPYGYSKLMIEQIIKDITMSDSNWTAISLRYFNPVGAHPSGLLGESPIGIPNNLVPYITQVASGKLTKLNVYGSDYNTKDGSGVRDYIHVLDLASGHTAALNKIGDLSGFNAFNLGTGKGYSVLELISCFEKVNDVKVPFTIAERRDGDVAECWSSPNLANAVLKWKAKYSLEDMLKDAWRWECNNPNGY
ncbi:UDP-glucose 4-epimerase GalE [Escherichia coli]|nr:UDP-glucose 4-epimerase GalE [Escherichia coli]